MEEERVCHSCNKVLRGRMDKKFCDDYCRNMHNNQRNSERSRLIRNINNILRRNRRLLEAMLDGEPDAARTPRLSLQEKGFDFRYHTHLQDLQNGATYFFCYEYGYMLLEEGWLLLVKRNGGHMSGAGQD
jgi:hypothetical protein